MPSSPRQFCFYSKAQLKKKKKKKKNSFICYLVFSFYFQFTSIKKCNKISKKQKQNKKKFVIIIKLIIKTKIK